MHLYVAITAIFYAFWATCEILSIVGAVNNNKCLLVPFMICLSLTIVSCFGFGIFSGAAFDKAIFVRFDGIDIFFTHFIPVFIVLGMTIYVLAIVLKFYRELSSGVTGGIQPGMVL